MLQTAISPRAAKVDLAILLEEKARRMLGKRLDQYQPYKKQAEFHAQGATYRERMLNAGNQNGKTFSAAREMAYHLTGRYPSWWIGKRFYTPILAWASGETGEATRDNAQTALLGPVGETGTGAIPAKYLGGRDERGMAMGIADLYDYIKVRHITGGWSILRFKYYAQGRRKWQGPSVHVVWFDEEPPADVYDEGLARTIKTGGISMLTFTPLMGMSDVVRRFLMQPTPDRGHTTMTIHDAEHIPPSERERIILSFPAHERDARAKGIPTLGSGRIFPIDEGLIKIPHMPRPIPPEWATLGALDFGYDHPTACVQLWWDREADAVYVEKAHRARQQTPVLISSMVKPWGDDWLPWAWPHDGLQHGKDGGEQLAEQYRKAGLNMLPEMARFEETGVDDERKMSRVSVEAGVAEMLDRMQTGRFFVCAHLEEWFEEFRLYHRKDGKIVKEADDLLSATRYGIMMLRHAIRRPVTTIGTAPHRLQRREANWRAR